MLTSILIVTLVPTRSCVQTSELAVPVGVTMSHETESVFASSTAPAVNSLLEWV